MKVCVWGLINQTPTKKGDCMNNISIVNILVNRDNISKREAIKLIEETRDEIYEAIYNNDYVAPDEILMNNLGLEPDYLFDIISF